MHVLFILNGVCYITDIAVNAAVQICSEVQLCRVLYIALK